MHRPRDPILFLFSKPSKEQLVDYINRKNNRLLDPDLLLFGIPVLLDETGLTEVDISFKSTSGWSQEKSRFTYNRIDLSIMLRGQAMVVHVSDDSEAAVYKAIFEQYGIFIEPELSTLTLDALSLPDLTPIDELPSFEPEGVEPLPPVVEDPPPYLINKNYTLRMDAGNLVYFGSIRVVTRRSIELLGTTIDSLLDLREFYATGSMDLPRIDLLTPNGVFQLTDSGFGLTTRRAYESYLFNIPVDTILGPDTKLASILSVITGDTWVSDEARPSNFNLKGSRVLHNGFVSKDYPSHAPAFNYVIAVELGKFCANLTGVLKIAYRYSDANNPSNLPYDRSYVAPLFNH